MPVSVVRHIFLCVSSDEERGDIWTERRREEGRWMHCSGGGGHSPWDGRTGWFIEGVLQKGQVGGRGCRWVRMCLEKPSKPGWRGWVFGEDEELMQIQMVFHVSMKVATLLTSLVEQTPWRGLLGLVSLLWPFQPVRGTQWSGSELFLDVNWQTSSKWQHFKEGWLSYRAGGGGAKLTSEDVRIPNTQER